jgi:DNA-binding response OmpR family regulator
MNILVVEDEYITADFIKNCLYDLGATYVETTDNDVDALELFTCENFDIVFMDINIKGNMDGVELGSVFHKKHGANIIFITSYQDSETIYKASFADPIGYVIKPITKADIESILMVAKRSLNKIEDKNHIRLDNYTFDLTTKTLTSENGHIKLSKLESKAIYLLIKNMNNTVHNETFFEYLWNEPKSNSTLRELIFRLRKKVPSLTIEKYSNIGYILKI